MAFSSTKKFSSESYNVYGDSSVVGDWTELVAAQRGGNDSFWGESNTYSYEAFGDAYTLSGRAIGGADYMQGGDWVGGGYIDSASGPTTQSMLGNGVHFAGDAGDMSGLTIGGNDTIIGGWNSDSEFYGDAAGTMSQTAKGGADTLYASNVEIYDYYSSFDFYQYVTGDGYAMTGSSRGGADQIYLGSVQSDGYASIYSYQAAVGDGFTMMGAAVGAADTLYGGDVNSYQDSSLNVMEYLIGDGAYMTDKAVGGNDTIYGGSAYAESWSYSSAYLYNIEAGDGYSVSGTPKFGADTLYGGSNYGGAQVYNLMFGDTFQWVSPDSGPASAHDAMTAHDFSLASIPTATLTTAHTGLVYGADKLYGGDGYGTTNMMVGDTYDFYAGDKGGNDVITGGGFGSSNMMIGDGYYAYGSVTGGADRLISGMGNDQMWGDFASTDGHARGGADVFVFGPNNGNDVIYDFQVGVDHIDLTAFSSDRTMPHTYRALVNSGLVEEVDGAVIIHLDSGVGPVSDWNTVTVIGVTLHDLSNSFYF